MKVYKLYFFCDDSSESKRYIFDQIELLSESGLKDRLKEAIEDEQLCGDTMFEYGLDKNTDVSKLSTEKIIEIFDYDGYTIQENDIKI